MPVAPDPTTLDQFPLLEGLTGTQLAEIGRYMRRQHFAAGTNIMTEGQPGEVVYFIAKGTVKIFVEQMDGSRVILALLGPGATVGEMSLVEPAGDVNAERSATVLTLEDATLFWMDRVTFQGYLQSMPELTLNLARALARRLRLANAQIQSLATQDVFGRVARQIVALADAYGRPGDGDDIRLPLRLTQSDLSNLVGASRVRVNQVLVHFKQRGYISVESNYHMTIHDMPALMQRCR
jgi:CRP-like cAMP-binding protein